MHAIVKLSLVVAKIFRSRMVFYVENPLRFLTQQPKIPHVHRPRTLTLDRRIHNSDISRIVDTNGSAGVVNGQVPVGQVVKFNLHRI